MLQFVCVQTKECCNIKFCCLLERQKKIQKILKSTLWMSVINFLSFDHVIQVANSENFLLWPNFAFNFRKRHKICSGNVFYFRSYQQKASRVWTSPLPPPPVLLRLRYGWKPNYVVLIIEINCTPLKDLIWIEGDNWIRTMIFFIIFQIDVVTVALW